MDKNIGRKLDGRYEITELIGVGGMADVYKAVDILEDKIVAVKILKNEFSGDEDFIRRFRNESKAIALLSHPNIVKIYDVGFTEKIQFIVMEYIDGITLKEFMEQQGALKWKDSVHFIIQVLRALQHAHDKGIVHRDIKPQNIMLFPDGTIKVMDFGIARFAREEGKTLSDKAIGSVHYISPEQARGDITDEKSDIYSVGAMLYEMLSGEKPFDADNPVSVALMHMQSKPKKLRNVNSNIPEGLEEIVMRAMQKDASKRYQSASEMIRDIEEFKKNPSIVFEYKYLTSEPEGATKYFDRVKPVNTSGKRNQMSKKYDYYDDYDGDYEEEKKKSLFVPILTAVTVAVFIIAAVFCTILLIDVFNKEKQGIMMPNLIGQDYNVAVNAIGGSFKVQIKEQDYSDYGENIIYWQSKDEGSTVYSDSVIQVSVSKGVKPIVIPNIQGLEASVAKKELEKRELSVTIANTTSSTVQKDYVIDCDPPVGSTVKKGQKIILVVSVGPEKLSVIMPNLLGKTEQEAIDILTEKKLQYVPVPKDSDQPKGTVLSQSIPENEFVEQDTEVSLEISTGNLPTKTFQISVPIPSNVEGAYEFIGYVNGDKAGSVTVDNVAYADSAALQVTGSGHDKTLIIEVKNLETGVSSKYMTYSFDFVTGGYYVISSDSAAF